MKKFPLLPILALSASVCLSACAPVKLPTGDALFVMRGMPPDSKDESVSPPPAREEAPVPYTVLYEAPHITRAKHEPPFGCYVGALLPETEDVRRFNKEIKHAVYVKDVVLGEEFPVNFMLSCIAAQATPLLVVHPNPKTGLTIPQISACAQWLGGYNLPLFVAFAPVTAETEMSAENYKVYFRHAKQLFKIQTPMAALVWLADSQVKNPNDYYPGHDAVDWVAFSSMEEDLSVSFEDFYMDYQEEKPVILGPFGVSYFSDEDYKYYVEEAAGKITGIYTSIRDTYPRVKMIAYADVNLIPEGGGHNYSFSENGDLEEAYAAATEDGYYLTALSQTENSPRSEWLRLADKGYIQDGKPQITGQAADAFGNILPDHAKRVMYAYVNAAQAP